MSLQSSGFGAYLELMEELSAQSGDLHWVVDLRSNELVYLSETYDAGWGRDLDPLPIAVTEWVANIHPDDRAAVLSLDDHASDFRRTFRVRGDDDSLIWVRSVGHVVRDDDGAALHLVGLSRDLGEARPGPDGYYRSLLEHIRTGIVAIDAAGVITYANEQISEMTHIPLGHLLGRGIGDVSPWRTGPYTSLMAEARESLQPVSYDALELATPQGESFWYSGWFIPRRDENGAFAGMTCTVEDVSDRERAQRERQRLKNQIQYAQKLDSLGVLAGGIAHNFNNLLMGILGNASLALMDLSPESPARESVRDVEIATKRAAELVKQMLAYSGKGRFVVESLRLESIISEMTHLLEVSISKNAVLKFNFSESVPPVVADATQIRQVIMNLVTNASDAIGDRSGVISIGTGAMDCDQAYLTETYLDDDLAPGIYSYIEVSDTGEGMGVDTRSRLFDPFFTTKFTGRGLGLAAVLGIVRGHRGAIKVYSEEGKGTTFKVLLPSSMQGLEATTSVQSPDATWRGEGKVLLVDDDETILAISSRMLVRLGFEVVTAADGREAVDLLRAAPDTFVLVILDLTMPRMGGDETYREMRRIKRDVLVLLSSGYNEREVTQKFAGKGLAGFIQKPYRANELAAKVRKALDPEQE